MSKRAILIPVFVLALASHQAIAAGKSSMKLPPGSHAEVHGPTAMIRGSGSGGNNISARVSCVCLDNAQGGSCSIIVTGQSLVCAPSKDHGCSRNCLLQTTVGDL